MIFLGADHGGYDLKERLKGWLDSWDVPYTDLGATRLDPDDDFPQFAFAVAQAVAKNPDEHRGIVACRSAGGVIIAANKVRGVRASAAFTLEQALHDRHDDDVNVLGLAGDWLSVDEAKLIVQHWLDTPFLGKERHLRRIAQITDYEQTHSL